MFEQTVLCVSVYVCKEGREKVVFDGQRSECNTAFHFLLTGVSPEVLGSMGITHVKVRQPSRRAVRVQSSQVPLEYLKTLLWSFSQSWATTADQISVAVPSLPHTHSLLHTAGYTTVWAPWVGEDSPGEDHCQHPGIQTG